MAQKSQRKCKKGSAKRIAKRRRSWHTRCIHVRTSLDSVETEESHDLDKRTGRRINLQKGFSGDK